MAIFNSYVKLPEGKSSNMKSSPHRLPEPQILHAPQEGVALKLGVAGKPQQENGLGEKKKRHRVSLVAEINGIHMITCTIYNPFYV